MSIFVNQNPFELLSSNHDIYVTKQLNILTSLSTQTINYDYLEYKILCNFVDSHAL